MVGLRGVFILSNKNLVTLEFSSKIDSEYLYNRKRQKYVMQSSFVYCNIDIQCGG